MAILVPAILTKDPEEVFRKLKFLESLPEITDVQIDFEDGKFVNNDTVLPRALGPLATRLRVEAHLMVQEPQQYFHDLEAMGAKFLFLHYESFPEEGKLLTAVRNAQIMGFECGVALNPETELTVVDRLAGKIDGILLMSVNPGWQGQEFLPETFDRLQILRKAHENAIIEVDGGMKLENFGRVVASGANRIVVGSGIWKTPDPKQTIHDFLSRIK